MEKEIHLSSKTFDKSFLVNWRKFSQVDGLKKLTSAATNELQEKQEKVKCGCFTMIIKVSILIEDVDIETGFIWFNYLLQLNINNPATQICIAPYIYWIEQ